MSFSHKLQELLTGPAQPEKDYALSKYTYKDIYTIAAYFQQTVFSRKNEEAICLCVTDRAIIAGALLAALTRPVTLVIPHDYSAAVIDRMQKIQKISKAIVSDSPPDLPNDIKPLVIDRHLIDSGPDELDVSFLRPPESVFVKLFTGGSTHSPRIWSKTIRNLFAESIYHAKKLNVTPDDKIVATVPPNHIYGLLFSVLMPFVASAAVIDEELSYPHEIQNAINQNQPEILVSIPLHYKMLAAATCTTGDLRYALSSAARLDAADSRLFHEKTGLGITEIFGSTETGGIATRLCQENQPDFNPFDCIDWKAEDHLLAIRSDFISPELSVDPDGFFVTNDKVVITAPNAFRVTGRADRIIKVGGNRVDLDEIRSIITAMPEVKDAAVICTPNKSGRENEIHALVATGMSASDIRHYLQQRIPGYAVPRRIRIVDKIPVSSAGKYKNEEIKKLIESDSVR